MSTENQEILLHYSPDADDLFMMYALLEGKVRSPNYSFRMQRDDIEVLNRNARLGNLTVTALSVHAYAYVSNTYAILNCGASFAGKDFGPRLLSLREDVLEGEGKYRIIAIPGEMTSANLALQIYLKENKIEAELVSMPFDKIQDAVSAGDVDAGVVIHEGQLTYTQNGLKNVLDLGAWWWQKFNLPLPLGIIVIKRSFPDKEMREISALVKASIQYGLDHRDETLDYAVQDARGLTRQQLNQYIDMYVNEYTIDMGESGKSSIDKFLKLGVDYGIVPEMPHLIYV